MSDGGARLPVPKPQHLSSPRQTTHESGVLLREALGEQLLPRVEGGRSRAGARRPHSPHSIQPAPRRCTARADPPSPPLEEHVAPPLLCDQPAPAPTSRRACSSTTHACIACALRRSHHADPATPLVRRPAARHGGQVERHAAPLAPRPSPRPSSTPPSSRPASPTAAGVARSPPPPRGTGLAVAVAVA